MSQKDERTQNAADQFAHLAEMPCVSEIKT